LPSNPTVGQSQVSRHRREKTSGKQGLTFDASGIILRFRKRWKNSEAKDFTQKLKRKPFIPVDSISFVLQVFASP
jgi:hypothetical protein